MKKIQTVTSFLLYAVILASCASFKMDEQNVQFVPTKTPCDESKITAPINETANAADTENSSITENTSIQTESKEDSTVQNFEHIYTSFTQIVKTTNWIRQVSTSHTYNEQTQTYSERGIFEEWFRFDADGNYIEGYNWIMAPNGTIEQESCFLNGRIYNVTYQSFNKGDVASSIDFSGGFAKAIKSGEKITQESVVYQDVDAWKFSYEMKDGIMEFVHTIYFDCNTDLILGKETWLKEADGATRLVSSTIINNFEVDSDPPLEHFRQISDQVPQ